MVIGPGRLSVRRDRRKRRLDGWPRTSTRSAERSSDSDSTAGLRRATHSTTRSSVTAIATSKGSPSTLKADLWASEFGQQPWDELNLITKGAELWVA